jgi:hypothetical protein
MKPNNHLLEATNVQRIFMLLGLAILGGCAALDSSHIASDGGGAVATGGYYFLPKTLLHVRILATDSDVAVDYFDEGKTVALERSLVPDTDQFYTLDYHRSALSEDALNISVGTNGLLKKVESSTEDKSGAIIIKMVEIAKEVAKAASMPAGTATKVGDYVFDPEDVDALNARLRNDFGSGAIRIDITPRVTKSDTSRACDDGLCFRPLRPYVVTIVKNGLPFRTQTVLIPNGAPVLSLPIHRAAFVKNITNATFDDGILTEVHIEKPSEALAFMEIPLAIAKAVTSVPTELLQLKIDYSSKEKDLAEAEKARLDAMRSLIEDRQKNKKTSTDGGADNNPLD